MRAIRAIYYENATEEQVREIWRRKYESKWKKSRKENAFEYKLSSFDIDNDGVVEDVLMEVRTECSKNWMLPSSPRIFVLDKKTDRIDPRYGVWESNVLRSEEHTSELKSLMRNSYAVYCLITYKMTQKFQ